MKIEKKNRKKSKNRKKNRKIEEKIEKSGKKSKNRKISENKKNRKKIEKSKKKIEKSKKSRKSKKNQNLVHFFRVIYPSGSHIRPCSIASCTLFGKVLLPGLRNTSTNASKFRCRMKTL